MHGTFDERKSSGEREPKEPGAERKPRGLGAWRHARKAEIKYARSLRRIARHIGHIVTELWTGPSALQLITQALEKYAAILTPWAEATAARMITETAKRDEAAWAKTAKTMSRALRVEVKKAPTGQAFRNLMDEQVVLIKSLPLDASKRVHEMVLKNQEGAIRAKTLAEEIARTGEVSIGKANTIARTETARAASTLLQARAEYIGSEGYIWRSCEDQQVRPTHRRLNGRYFKWDEPPVSEADGVTRSHPGQVWNCRCYPEPVIPEELQ